MIVPTVGRMLHYYPPRSPIAPPPDQPLPAQISYVYDNRSVNIGYLDKQGRNRNALAVQLVQDDDVPNTVNGFCVWMDYQKQQASKAPEGMPIQLTLEPMV